MITEACRHSFMFTDTCNLLVIYLSACYNVCTGVTAVPNAKISDGMMFIQRFTKSVN